MARSLWVGVVMACREEPAPPGSTTDDPVDTEDTSLTTTETGGELTTGSTGDTGQPPLEFDCTTIPDAPVSVTQLAGPRGYHDLAFDPLGNVIGFDGFSLLQVTYVGAVQVYLPSTGVVQGMDWLPGGDLVYADGIGSLIRVTPQRQPSVLAAGSGTVYGVTVGPDGMVYAANWTSIDRFQPGTGQRTRILDAANIPPYVLDFSPDHRTMYVGTIWGGGSIWTLDLDEDLNRIGPPVLFATIGSGDQQLHDALAVDWCGNVYVAEFYTNDLYRITPEGEVSVLFDYSDVTYGHGIEWGSGVGGWRADAIYVPQPYNNNQVMEIVVGVPSREYTGTQWPPE